MLASVLRVVSVGFIICLIGVCTALIAQPSPPTCGNGYVLVEEENVCVPDIGPLPIITPIATPNLSYTAGPIAEDDVIKGYIHGIKIINDNSRSYVIEDVYGRKQSLTYIGKDKESLGLKEGQRIAAKMVTDPVSGRLSDTAKTIKLWSFGRKEELGKHLFCDSRLAAVGQYGCANCHLPDHGFAGRKPVSRGVGGVQGTRKAPTLYNVSFNPILFWDGRAGSLEEQVTHPIMNPIEMHMTPESVVKRVKEISNATDSPYNYEVHFREVFGSDINFQGLAEAIAAFERTIVSTNSPFDKCMDKYNDKCMDLKENTGDFGEAEKKGMILFKGKARCILCHYGPNFTDNKFHNVGYPQDETGLYILKDQGRYKITRAEYDKGAFKTPTLRGIAETWPYMHDGLLPKDLLSLPDNDVADKGLKAVLDLFDSGGGQKNPNVDPLLKPLGLSPEEKDSVIAFLKALTGHRITLDDCPFGTNVNN